MRATGRPAMSRNAGAICQVAGRLGWQQTNRCRRISSRYLMASRRPALAANANLETPDYPIYLILNGQKAMPPVGDVMDDAQIAAVVNYIRHNLGNNYEGETTAEDVAAAR